MIMGATVAGTSSATLFRPLRSYTTLSDVTGPGALRSKTLGPHLIGDDDGGDWVGTSKNQGTTRHPHQSRAYPTRSRGTSRTPLQIVMPVGHGMGHEAPRSSADPGQARFRGNRRFESCPRYFTKPAF
jgi:hypothetical protein